MRAKSRDVLGLCIFVATIVVLRYIHSSKRSEPLKTVTGTPPPPGVASVKNERLQEPQLDTESNHITETHCSVPPSAVKEVLYRSTSDRCRWKLLDAFCRSHEDASMRIEARCYPYGTLRFPAV